jgi:hypothetical protein
MFPNSAPHRPRRSARPWAIVALAGLVSIAAAGCAHRGGLPMPGPTDRMGQKPDALGPRTRSRGADEGHRAARHSESRAERRAPRGVGEQVAEAAGALVGQNPLVVDGQVHRYDCSGFVIAAHAGAGLHLRGSTKDMYERADAEGLLHDKKVGRPGDVVFFDNTYDRNHNKRRDDDLSHIAIVERVLPDGTMTLVHLGSDGVVRIAMNLKHPEVRANEDGEVINSYIRPARDAKSGPVLTGALFRGFGVLYALPGAEGRDAVSDL